MNTTTIKIRHPEMNEAPIRQVFFADLIQNVNLLSYACQTISEIYMVY